MGLHSNIEEARNVAFQKVGRNVVNFQKMEAMLKYLLAFGQISGSVDEIEMLLSKRVTSISKLPMGRLAQHAERLLYTASSAPTPPVESASEARFSSSISLNGGRDGARAWQAAMKVVVEGRNQLIHRLLADFDPESMQSCKQLCVRLDEQREEMRATYAHLATLVATLRDAYKELSVHIEAAIDESSDENNPDGS